MKSKLKKNFALLCAGVSIAVISANSANAAFFALREQSAYNQGASFAGASAQTNALSSFFFNPAIVTEFEGFTVDGTLSVVLPFTDAETTVNPITAAGTAAAGAPIGGRQTTGNIGKEALIPATYIGYQVTDKIWGALALNAPFGLGTRSDPNSLESLSSQEFSAASINIQPTIAYKFNERFSVAVGAQVQYIDIEQSANQLNGTNTELNATGWSAGAILGATFKPTERTTLGVGYRSQMNVDVDGDVRSRLANPGLAAAATGVAALAALPAGTEVPGSGNFATANVALPDIVNFGISHKITNKLTGLFQFSWENWSRLQGVEVFAPGLSTTTPAAEFSFNLRDSFFYSVGGEYEVNDHLKFRAGIAYETSPTNDEDRSLALPDNNRLWVSAGGTHKLSDHIESDFGFTWIRVEGDTPVSNEFQPATTLAGGALGPLAGLPIASGTADSNVFIFTAGTRVRF